MMFKFVVIILFIFLSACLTQQVDDCTNYDYSDCNTLKPDSALVTIKFSTTKLKPFTLLKIYHGFAEDSNLVISDSFPEGILKLSLPVNKYYSVQAFYHLSDTKIIAVDGQKLKIWKVQVCDSICWNNNSPVIDVKLKR